MQQDMLRDIVTRAARAPSVHNTQPWRFVLRGDVIELWTDASRSLPVLDPSGRARYISCGAALLHARVAAAAAGLATEVALAPDPGHPDHLADVHLHPTVGVEFREAQLGAAIDHRRTGRDVFTAEALGDDTVVRLQAAAAAEDCWLRLVDDPADATAVAVLLARADEAQTRDPAYREELRQWTTRDESAADGIPVAVLPDVAPAERVSNYRLRDFDPDRSADPAPAPATRDADAGPRPPERPLVAVLGTADDDIASWIAAGQGLARVLLTATCDELAASPMTQALEYVDTRARLATELGVLGNPQMILRLGHLAATAWADQVDTPMSPRRPLEEILS